MVDRKPRAIAGNHLAECKWHKEMADEHSN